MQKKSSHADTVECSNTGGFSLWILALKSVFYIQGCKGMCLNEVLKCQSLTATSLWLITFVVMFKKNFSFKRFTNLKDSNTHKRNGAITLHLFYCSYK